MCCGRFSYNLTLSLPVSLSAQFVETLSFPMEFTWYLCEKSVGHMYFGDILASSNSDNWHVYPCPITTAVITVLL